MSTPCRFADSADPTDRLESGASTAQLATHCSAGERRLGTIVATTLSESFLQVAARQSCAGSLQLVWSRRAGGKSHMIFGLA